jgi:hypothetical protein
VCAFRGYAPGGWRVAELPTLGGEVGGVAA